MNPRPMRLASSTPRTSYRKAYVIGGMELRDAVKVGEYNGVDVIHTISGLQKLKDASNYLGGTYKSLKDAPVVGQQVHDAVFVIVYEVEELVEKEQKLVRKQMKKSAWEDAGCPGSKVTEQIPHVFFGAETE